MGAEAVRSRGFRTGEGAGGGNGELRRRYVTKDVTGDVTNGVIGGVYTRDLYHCAGLASDARPELGEDLAAALCAGVHGPRAVGRAVVRVRRSAVREIEGRDRVRRRRCWATMSLTIETNVTLLDEGSRRSARETRATERGRARDETESCK